MRDERRRLRPAADLLLALVVAGAAQLDVLQSVILPRCYAGTSEGGSAALPPSLRVDIWKPPAATTPRAPRAEVARCLDPAQGRFVSRDPLGLWGDPGQAGNAQSFCGNDPVNRVDPWGLDAAAAGRQVAQAAIEAQIAILSGLRAKYVNYKDTVRALTLSINGLIEALPNPPKPPSVVSYPPGSGSRMQLRIIDQGHEQIYDAASGRLSQGPHTFAAYVVGSGDIDVPGKLRLEDLPHLVNAFESGGAEAVFSKWRPWQTNPVARYGQPAPFGPAPRPTPPPARRWYPGGHTHEGVNPSGLATVLSHVETGAFNWYGGAVGAQTIKLSDTGQVYVFSYGEAGIGTPGPNLQLGAGGALEKVHTWQDWAGTSLSGCISTPGVYGMYTYSPDSGARGILVGFSVAPGVSFTASYLVLESCTCGCGVLKGCACE